MTTLYRWVDERRGPHGHMQPGPPVAVTDDGRILLGEDALRELHRTNMHRRTFVSHGCTVDADFAAYMKAHGLGERLVPVPEPNLSTLCPLDARVNCGKLSTARSKVRTAAQRGIWGTLAGIEVDDRGHVDAKNERATHLILVAEREGYDWRGSARVHSGSHALPYRMVFAEPYPNPRLPSVDPPAPQPSVVTPSCVRRWLAERIAAGELVPLAGLPAPATRRELRRAAGISQRALAELLGLRSAEAIRLWETGKREPTGEHREQYLTVLTEWHNRAQSANGQQRQPEPEPGAAPEPDAPEPPPGFSWRGDPEDRRLQGRAAAVAAVHKTRDAHLAARRRS